jgi:hypothetical protein
MSETLNMTASPEERVRSIVIELLHGVDSRQWSALPSLFTESVTTDYTSLFGGEVQRQSRDTVVGGWRQLLSPLDATQHILGPILVRVNGERAAAECHVRGYHVSSKVTGGGEWMVAGHYVFEMERDRETWRIASLTLQAFYQTGNRDLLRQVAQ